MYLSALQPPMYIAAQIGLISFPAGVHSVTPPLAVTSLCDYNIGYVANWIENLRILSGKFSARIDD